MRPATRQRLRLLGGTELSFITAGEATKPAVLLLHGSPSSARMFREVIPELSQAAYVIAPDLPGFGESDVLPSPSFPAFGQAISELLERLSIGPRYIYLHDYGAPVGFHIAMQAPEHVLGLIVQNGNAHRTGLGPQWDATQAPYWSNPTPENEAAATAHQMVVYRQPAPLVLDQLFGALADATRRDILARVMDADASVSELAAHYDMSFAAVQKHVAVLERARLVTKRRDGRAQRVAGNPDAVRRATRLLAQFEQRWQGRVSRLDKLLDTLP